MRLAGAVVLAAGVALTPSVGAAPVISEQVIFEAGQAITIASQHPLGAHRVMLMTSLGCLVVEPDLTAPGGLFDCASPATAGASIALVWPLIDGSFEARDAGGRVIYTSGAARIVLGHGAGTDGSRVLVTRIEGSGQLRGRLYAANGSVLIDWSDLGTGPFISIGAEAVAHDGTGWVVAWPIFYTMMGGFPEYERVAIAPVDDGDGLAMGTVEAVSDESPLAQSRAFLALDCDEGHCFLSYDVALNMSFTTAWALWVRASEPRVNRKEQVFAPHGAAFDRGGRADQVRYGIEGHSDGEAASGIIRVDATTGERLDGPEAFYPELSSAPRMRIGDASLAVIYADGEIIRARRVDYLPGAGGAPCHIAADCASGVCDAELCTAVIAEPDAGPPPDAMPASDAAALPDATLVPPDAEALGADAAVSCPQGSSNCPGTGCSCRVGLTSARPAGAALLIFLGVGLLIRRARRPG